eukprot:1522818-Amphidinium_carterae.1
MSVPAHFCLASKPFLQRARITVQTRFGVTESRVVLASTAATGVFRRRHHASVALGATSDQQSGARGAKLLLKEQLSNLTQARH